MPNLNPFSSPDKASNTPPQDTDIVTGKVSEWTDILYQWWWMGLVLVLFFPQVREPIIQFWTAIFRALAVPFEFMRMKWDNYKVDKSP